MKQLLAFALVLSCGAARAETDACTAISAQVGKACTKGAGDSAVASQFANECQGFSERLKTLDAKLDALAKECATTGSTTSKRAGRKGRGDQSLAPKDTSTLAGDSANLMSSCATRMKAIEDEYKELAQDVGKAVDSISGASPACAQKAKAAYQKIQSRAQERAAKAEQLAAQYLKAAGVAQSVADRNSGNSDSMKGSGSNAGSGKGSGGGSGGGAPPMQMPQQQKQEQKQPPPQKTPQQIAAEQKAIRQAQCQNLIATYNNAIVTCYVQHKCQPEIARVKDVCDAYNACIAAAAPVPGDCQGAPQPAQPK